MAELPRSKVEIFSSVAPNGVPEGGKDCGGFPRYDLNTGGSEQGAEVPSWSRDVTAVVPCKRIGLGGSVVCISGPAKGVV